MSHIYHQVLSDKLLGMAFEVHNVLGPGLLESAYEEAFCVELSQSGIFFERQKVYPLVYKGHDIGGYIADIVVDNAVIRSAWMLQSRECQGWQERLIS
jgi:GxxExxY protein